MCGVCMCVLNVFAGKKCSLSFFFSHRDMLQLCVLCVCVLLNVFNVLCVSVLKETL